MFRIVFFGTPLLACPFFEKIVTSHDCEIVACVTQPDAPAGRHQHLSPSPIKTLATKYNIPCFTFPTLRSKEVETTLKNLQADLFVVVAYGNIIPESLLLIPPLGTLNMHPSLLPEYRGPSPIPGPILDGKQETGITCMLLDKGMDTGPIIRQTHFSLNSDETTETLTQKIMQLGPPFFLESLLAFARKEVSAYPQPQNTASTTTLFTREMGRIHWNTPAEIIERRIRALNPWPGTWTTLQHDMKTKRLKILAATLTNKASIPPGKIIQEENRILIGTATQPIELTRVQMEGANACTAQAWIRGYSQFIGTVLG